MPTKITTTAQKRTRKARKFVDSEAEESDCDEFDESSIEYSDSEFDEVCIGSDSDSSNNEEPDEDEDFDDDDDDNE